MWALLAWLALSLVAVCLPRTARWAKPDRKPATPVAA
jgi:hypothetical protein